MTAATTLAKFTTSAGPRQTKAITEAISAFLWRAKTTRVLTDHGSHETTGMCSPHREECLTVYHEIHAKYAGEITRDNHKAVLADFVKATEEMVLPVEDERTTEQERQERAQQFQESQRKREEEATKKASRVDTLADELRKKYPWAVGPDGFKTGAARAAANLKRELTEAFPGVKFSVKSSTFSMGDSVDVNWEFGPTVKEVEAISGKYVDGHFNGMEDLYEYDRSDEGEAVDKVLGRAKYVSEDRDTDGLGQKVAEWYLAQFKQPEHCKHDYQRQVSEIIRNTSFAPGVTLEHVTGLACIDGDYVLTVETPATQPPAKVETSCGAGFTIEKHYHAKRGCDFFLVVPISRLTEEDYRAVLPACRSAGGWQSKKWGKTPSGFGFATEEEATKFVANQSPSIAEGVSTPAPEIKSISIADKFRDLADNMQKTIDEKTAPLSQNWTYKRGREHASRVVEGRQLERAQIALRKLADLWEAGTVPAVLQKLTTKTAIVELCRNKLGRNHSTDCVFDTGERYHEQPEAIELYKIIDPPAIDPKKQRIEQLIGELRLSDAEGFFPTPEYLADRMVELLDVRPGHRVLEPSAGIGSLCDAVRKVCPLSVITGFELRSKLVEVTQLKGFECHCEDFTEVMPVEHYDRVIMNPPFERGQDWRHVKLAFNHLKPGGKLVAVMSEGPFFRADAVSFREWFEHVGGFSEKVEDGFKGAEAFRQTGVSVRLVVIGKGAE